MSSQTRVRKKRSMPSAMSRVMKGRIGSTRAPTAAKALAAVSTVARTSASTASPQPASSSRPIVSLPTSMSSAIQSVADGGRLIESRQSGRVSCCINNAASFTLRVIGPATRP